MAYPTTIPIMAESRATREGGFVPVRATNGLLKVRRLWSAEKWSFDLVHWLSSAQRTTLETAYAANRTNNVTLTWPADGSTYTCRFASAPSYEWRTGGFWVARVRLEEV
jgi:hypothetical protein